MLVGVGEVFVVAVGVGEVVDDVGVGEVVDDVGVGEVVDDVGVGEVVDDVGVGDVTGVCDDVGVGLGDTPVLTVWRGCHYFGVSEAVHLPVVAFLWYRFRCMGW